MNNIIQSIYNIVWSPALLVMLVGAGLYFSIRTRFVQVRRLGLMVKMMLQPSMSTEKKGFSPFQALCVSISGRVGTGNIVGVATAIALGGPGSVFWMWVIAFLGASTAFTEATLAQIYKFPHSKSFRGGPASYIEKGLKLPWLGIAFAVLTVLGYGMLLLFVQSNGAAAAFYNSMAIPKWATGVILAFFVGLVIMGGVKRISSAATTITPFMAITYIVLSLVVVFSNVDKVPEVLALIVSNAFGINPLVGGIFGSTVSMGIKRGLFSNEAGQGGGAIVAAGALNELPAQQGLVQAFSVYIDTLLVCSSTAFMILCTGQYNVIDQATGALLYAGAPELGNNYVQFTQSAIDSVFNGVGSTLVSMALWLFVFTTMMAYYYYAESSIIFIFNRNNNLSRKVEKLIIWLYRILFIVFVFWGSFLSSDTTWMLGDIGVGVTAWINVIALFLLFPQALKALRDCEQRYPRKKLFRKKSDAI